MFHGYRQKAQNATGSRQSKTLNAKRGTDEQVGDGSIENGQELSSGKQKTLQVLTTHWSFQAILTECNSIKTIKVIHAKRGTQTSWLAVQASKTIKN